jgi:predicted ferric reductase
MTPAKRFLWGFLAALTALWWLADGTALSGIRTFVGWRNLWMQLSGVLAIGVMSVALLLALRPVRLEPWLGGLDKMYRLHKWLGMAALALSTSHWLMAQGPKWLTGLGLMTRGARPPRPPLPEGALRQFLLSQRGLAESVGEWTFYLAAVLMVVALVKWFPYKFFLKTHQLLAAAYLALVAHALVLLQWDYWATPLGLVMAVLLLAGSVAALLLLPGRLARSRRVDGQVLRVRRQERLGVLEIEIQLQDRWAGHAAGQFAFVTLHADEGPHPYTISSSWKNDGRVTFLIKALGDYTQTLPARVAVGDAVTLEGPYGRFNFEGPKQRQIWVAGGIGITPFVARMKDLAHKPDTRTVDLLHTTAVYDQNVMGLLQQDAQAAGVRLQVMWDKRDGRLDARGLARMVPDWQQADIWFCGPAAFGQALREGLLAMGMDRRSFHQEMFEMR